jgi:hypothetical protein
MIRKIDEIIHSFDQKHEEQEKYDQTISRYYKKRMINRLNYREPIEEVIEIDEADDNMKSEADDNMKSEADDGVESEIDNDNIDDEIDNDMESETYDDEKSKVILRKQNKKCPKCEKEFTRYESLKYHIDNNSCKEYACYCQYCGKGFTTNLSMCRHITSACKEKKEIDLKKDTIYESLKEMETKMEEKMEIKIKKINNNHKQEIKKLSLKIKKLEVKYNTIIIAHGKEDIYKIVPNDIVKTLKYGYKSIIHLIELIYFNSKYPEFQNVYISNIKDKYAMVYDGNKWILDMKKTIIDNMYDKYKKYIEDNMESFVEVLKNKYKIPLQQWLDIDESDQIVADIKEDIKLLLYNSRDIPLNTFNNKDQI